MTHCNTQQTAALHAIPAFAAWARARGFRVGDWVLYDEAGWLVSMTLEEIVRLVDVGYRLNADCRLMASGADLFAYLRSRGFGTISFVLLDGGEEGVELWKHGERWGYAATTRIGTLVAAVVAVGGGE